MDTRGYPDSQYRAWDREHYRRHMEYRNAVGVALFDTWIHDKYQLAREYCTCGIEAKRGNGPHFSYCTVPLYEEVLREWNTARAK